MSKKFYAVRVGRDIGIFTDWDSCKASVWGFSGAIYKSFSTKQLAEEFLNDCVSKSIVVEGVSIYTDGSSMNKKGGYAFILLNGGDSKEFHGRVPFSSCTNNQAELYAVYKALLYCKENVNVYTDSKYVMDCVTNFIEKWLKNGWKTVNGKDVANRELIENIYNCMKNRQVNYFHVKGHSGNIYNEKADKLAKLGCFEKI